ncbi:MAG: hypothetical protein AAB971_02720 [Patescibacteria group bacterium]
MKDTSQKQPQNEQGMILVAIISIMIFLGVILMGMFSLATSNLSRAQGRIFTLQAQYAAESGADAAVAIFNSGNTSYTGTSSEVNVLSANKYRATYSVSVAGSSDKERILTAVGRVYVPSNASTAKYVRTIKVTAQRSSAETAAGITARNIVYIESGVKNIQAVDTHANGFIYMNKNTTNLIAENITVAGKNTGASNCSIGGTGNLVKPSSFTTPGQTKTNITTAYNNCINPPGNSSNANFNVLANQSNVPTLASSYIPWSQYMDSSYQNADNCNDLTSGAFPRDLPKVSGSKKTHYPNSGSNISLLCGLFGSLGDLGLGNGQYNINDNVHIRGSICFLIACNVTFNNPDPTLKWVFIEGGVNFASLQTVAGSGPIVLVVYGSDPFTKIFSCPYGGAAYLGNSGTTNAPALYLLSMNGVCIDKTKFGASPALGGLSGKNIFVASNPGTPFDLKLDPAFPVSQIPIDLSWRAIRYQRL